MQVKEFLAFLGLICGAGIKEWTMFKPHTDKLEVFLLKVQ